MKKRRSSVSITGVLAFFALIAIVIQIAVLVYDYIIQRTTDKGLIAVLILIVIVILSAICTVADVIRRKIMVDGPVNKILEATKSIASGDFNTCLDITHSYEKYNEYDIIMENLNTMAAELGKSEILKADFISNVSHEIKTPLAVIQSYASLLADNSLDDEERKRYSRALLQATKRLNDLITNILKMNKLDNQEIKPDYNSFSLTDQLAQIIVGYEEILEEKGLELDCDLDEVTVTSCPSYLEIVWNNLISNAIKFTDQGKITVTLKGDNGGARVSVSDTGCGIDSETGSKIFEKFYRVHTGNLHDVKGFGLGLAYVRKIIQDHKGTIRAESELNVGTKFIIVLPTLKNE